jgi:hypothetical protein
VWTPPGLSCRPTSSSARGRGSSARALAGPARSIDPTRPSGASVNWTGDPNWLFLAARSTRRDVPPSSPPMSESSPHSSLPLSWTRGSQWRHPREDRRF